MKSILDPSFRYTPSAGTDLRKTFARIRREMLRQGPSTEEARASGNVLSITPRKSPLAPTDSTRLASEHP
jgi:hypothetical protein